MRSAVDESAYPGGDRLSLPGYLFRRIQYLLGLGNAAGRTPRDASDVGRDQLCATGRLMAS
jgi:hypothetical protein